MLLVLNKQHSLFRLVPCLVVLQAVRVQAGGSAGYGCGMEDSAGAARAERERSRERAGQLEADWLARLRHELAQGGPRVVAATSYPLADLFCVTKTIPMRRRRH